MTTSHLMDLYPLLFIFVVLFFGVGLIVLNSSSGSAELRFIEKVAFSPIYFLSFFILVYLMNIITGYSLLSSRFIIVSVFLIFLAMPLFFLYKNHRQTQAFKRLPGIHFQLDDAFKSLLFVLFLGYVVYLCLRANHHTVLLSGDIKRHILFTRQILNGFLFSHSPPYSENTLHSYPSLVHFSIAFFYQVFDIQIKQSYLFIYTLQLLLLPLGMFILVKKLTGDDWIALLAAILICFYSGTGKILWEPSGLWFNPARERFLPHHLTRTLGLSFVPFYFYALLSSLKKRGKRFYTFSSILALALTGLTHPYPFLFLLVFSFLFLVFNWTNNEIRKKIMVMVLAGALVGSLAYWPVILQSFQEKTTTSFHMVLESPVQVLLTPELFWKYYGLVGIMGIFSLFFCFWFGYNRFASTLLVAVALVLVLTYGKEVIRLLTGVNLPYHPAQHKFGKIFFLCFVILFSMLIHWVMARFSQLGGRTGRGLYFLSWVALLLVIWPGLQSTWSFARIYKQKNAGWQQNENMRISDKHSYLKLFQDVTMYNDVVSVPDELQSSFSLRTGRDVLLHDHPAWFSWQRKIGAEILYASKKNRKEIVDFLSVPYEELYLSVVKHFDIDCVIHTEAQSLQVRDFPFLDFLESTVWNKKKYYIYAVTDTNDGPGRFTDFFRSIFDSEKTLRLLLGYVPLEVTKVVVPGIYNNRKLNVQGLTSNGESLWLADKNKVKIYQIDTVSGKVLSSIDNPIRNPGGLAWGDGALWCVDVVTRMIAKISPDSGQVMAWLQTPAMHPAGLVFSEGFLWNADQAREQENRKIYKIDTSGQKNGLPATVCPAMTVGLAKHKETFWAVRKWRGRVYPVAEGNQEQISIHGRFYLHPALNRFTRLTHHRKELWIFDEWTKSLIGFQGRGVHCDADYPEQSWSCRRVSKCLWQAHLSQP